MYSAPFENNSVSLGSSSWFYYIVCAFFEKQKERIRSHDEGFHRPRGSYAGDIIIVMVRKVIVAAHKTLSDKKLEAPKHYRHFPALWCEGQLVRFCTQFRRKTNMNLSDCFDKLTFSADKDFCAGINRNLILQPWMGFPNG